MDEPQEEGRGAPAATGRPFTPRWLRLRGWSLRAKLGALVVASSVVPLAVDTWLDVRESEATLVAAMGDLLGARAEQIAQEFEGIHQVYLQSTTRVSRLPVTREICDSDPPSAALVDRLRGVFLTFPAGDPNVIAVAMLDRQGRGVVATDEAAVGVDFSRREPVRRAARGEPVITGIYASPGATGNVPRIGYIVPVQSSPGRAPCIITLWVRASAFQQRLDNKNGLAGPGSFAVVFDEYGIRMADSLGGKGAFHPAAPLPPQLLEQLVAAQRFGPRTRELLTEVLAAPEQAKRALAAVPDEGMFLEKAGPLNGMANFGAARRVKAVQRTVVYLSPQQNLTSQIADATRSRLLLALSLAGLGLLAALGFSASIVGGLDALARAAEALAEGKRHKPVRVNGDDELARLAGTFNSMAQRLRNKASALQDANERLEHRVNERTALLNAIIDTAMVVINVKDLDGRFRLVNDRFCEVYGRSKDEVAGRLTHEVFGQAAADMYAAMESRVVATGEALTDEALEQHADGIHTILCNKSPLRDEAGNVTGIVCVSTDITERKQAELRLIAQVERLRLLEEITTAIGSRHDLQSIYEEVVSSVEKHLPVDICVICRYEAETDTLRVVRSGPGGSTYSALLPATVPVGKHGLRRCLAGEVIFDPDMTGNPNPLPRALVAAGLRSAVLAPLGVEDQPFGVLIAVRRESHGFSSGDCEFLRQLSGHVALAAQQTQLTDALRVAYDDLRQSQQSMLQQERLSALGQMASGIAHDINNAVSPAALYVESLLERETGLSDRARHKLEIVSRAIDDVAATVARMREFYRSRESAAKQAAVDLNLVVQQVADLTRARWSDMPQQRGAEIDLRLELLEGLPLVSGSEHELREALINLVFNAVDAMPEGGMLVVRTLRGPAGGAAVEVQDNGIGMDAQTRRRCLEPFFTTKGERGTGLGLAMVYGVAQRHEADIVIDTEPGKGTTVRLLFPKGAAAAGPAMAEVVRAAPARILLVDDDPTLLASVADILESDGHAVTKAQGGAAGVAAFTVALDAGEAFDAVITDLGMPGMNGQQVARSIKALSPATPVVLLTGWGQSPGDSAAGMADIDRVMGKPPRLRELRTVLAELLPRSRP